MLAFVACTVGFAESLPTLPMLRIETGRHTAFIHALAIDESTGRLYSASEDKTVRVWRAVDGRLLDTFRIPIGLRAEGQLYALALSPNGQLLAVAGWTCWDTEGTACIYLLNAKTGAILVRIRGLSEVIASLRFSPDGRHLAVGLMAGQGLRVFNIPDGSPAAEDRAYRDKLLELDFSPTGRLVATGLDGFIRLYDAQFKLLGRVEAGLAGHQPFGIRYSPDGQRVAVGFNDTPQVSILRAADFSLITTLQMGALPAPRNLTRIAWAPDGTAVYATGEPTFKSASALFRWTLAEPQQPVPMRGAAGRIGDLVVTHRGDIVFGADDPALISMDPRGQRRYVIDSGVPDFRDAGARFRVSQDGSALEIPLTRAAMTARRFSVLRERRGAQPPLLSAPLLKSPGWKLSARRGGADPAGVNTVPVNTVETMTVNGKPLPLEPYEQQHAYAFSPDGKRLYVATEWALRAFDQSVKERWAVRMSTTVLAVNASGDGRFVLAALADGTIQWFSSRDGSLVLSSFLHADGEGWVTWTPDGVYASSDYGDLLVGWQLNRGADAAPDFFRAVQFERALYQPEMVAQRLFAAGRAESAAANQIMTILPARLHIEIRPTADGAGMLSVAGESTGLPMRDIAVYVNDIPVTAARQRGLTAGEANRFARQIPLALAATDNHVRVEVFNGRSLGVAEQTVPGSGRQSSVAPPGDLYVLAVGANQFPELSPSQYLSYAASDAEVFARAMQAGAARHFRQVHVQTLSDSADPANKSAVLASLAALAQQTTAADTLIVFLASHGISDTAGNYFFVPRDVRRADLDQLLDGKSLPGESSLIGWLSVFEELRMAAGRRLLIVDTCQARNIAGHFEDRALLKRSASSRIAFILAAQGDEESQEYTPAKHGLFTYALLDGLKPSAARGQLSIDQWFAHAAGVVDRFRDRTIGPQTPHLIAPPALRSMSVPVSFDP